MKHYLLLIPLLALCSCAGTKTSFDASKAEDSSASNSNSQSTESIHEIPPSAPILVAYFSATGNTKPLAEYAADRYNCDLFEIVPMQEYTTADINYSNSNCRALKEQADSDSRPEIKYEVEAMYNYSAIILGYPIWAMKAPRIIFSFLEAYDFEGKQILPFCTSGSTDISATIDELKAAAPKATWLDGKRFAVGTDKATFTEWLPTFSF